MMRSLVHAGRAPASFAFVLCFAQVPVLWARAAQGASEGGGGAEGADAPLTVTSARTRILDDARLLDADPEEDLLRILGHGEWQVRGSALAPLDLDGTPSFALQNPGASSQPLGQRIFGTQWLRLRPTLQWGKRVRVVAQADVFGGLVLGDLTQGVGADRTPRSAFDSIGNSELRWLFAEWQTPVGILRVGRQPSHWGLGALANDGDHRRPFGDYRRGSASDRVAFAARPFGAGHPLVVAAAGDIVRRDTLFDARRGDEAYQGALTLAWEEPTFEAGLLGALRQQTRARASVETVASYTDSFEALVGDVYVRAVTRLAGGVELSVGAEAAFVAAESDAPRTAAQLRGGLRTRVRGLGALAEIAIASGRVEQAGLRPRARWAATLEYGFASGQGDPFASTQSRFSFDPNHRVGLLLFDEILRWQSARAATALEERSLSPGSRPPAGVDLLPTNGAVSGAAYVNPVFVWRPDASVDLSLGVLVAQATADVVDPYRLVTEGAYVNYRGGLARGRDFGVEVDAALEKRWVSEAGLVPQLGLQGGVLFPGTALADAKGNTPAPPWIVQGRAGLQF